MPLDEQVPVLEQIADLPARSASCDGPHSLAAFEPGRPRPSLGMSAAMSLQLGHGGKDRLGHFLEDVEGADLMRYLTEDRGDRTRIERRAVGRDPLARASPARLQRGLKAVEERHDVLVSRVVVEDLVDQPLEGPVVDDREDAERPIIQLVGRDIAREVRQSPVEVVGVDPSVRLFPPRPRPSFGSLRRGQRHGARARGSSWHSDRASRPR